MSIIDFAIGLRDSYRKVSRKGQSNRSTNEQKKMQKRNAARWPTKDPAIKFAWAWLRMVDPWDSVYSEDPITKTTIKLRNAIESPPTKIVRTMRDSIATELIEAGVPAEKLFKLVGRHYFSDALLNSYDILKD